MVSGVRVLFTRGRRVLGFSGPVKVGAKTLILLNSALQNTTKIGEENAEVLLCGNLKLILPIAGQEAGVNKRFCI